MIGSAVSSLGSHDHSFLSLVYLYQGLLAWQISAGSQYNTGEIKSRQLQSTIGEDQFCLPRLATFEGRRQLFNWASLSAVLI